MSCRRCNGFKGTQIFAIDTKSKKKVQLFNPRTQNWNEHFQWSLDGTEINGKTPIGRATVSALNLNEKVIVVARRMWVSVGWFPPKE